MIDIVSFLCYSKSKNDSLSCIVSYIETFNALNTSRSAVLRHVPLGVASGACGFFVLLHSCLGPSGKLITQVFLPSGTLLDFFPNKEG